MNLGYTPPWLSGAALTEGEAHASSMSTSSLKRSVDRHAAPARPGITQE
jgi:hypothetical protein